MSTQERSEVAELTRRLALAEAIKPEDLATGLIARVINEDERLQVEDLEHTLPAPRACRGDASLSSPADFAAYVNRLASASTTLWADQDNRRVVAIFDDHADADSPGWRRHRAVLHLKADRNWSHWCNYDDRLVDQESFAEFVEDHIDQVVDPDPATMLEIATTFQAHRTATFERGTRLASGDVQLRWTETTTAKAGNKGQLEIPEKFTVKLTPYVGVEPVELIARLRYRINEGDLRIGFKLLGADTARTEAFTKVRDEIASGVTVPVLAGCAPDSLHPRHNHY